MSVDKQSHQAQSREIESITASPARTPGKAPRTSRLAGPTSPPVQRSEASGPDVQLRSADYWTQHSLTDAAYRGTPVQADGDLGGASAADVHEAAASGTAGAGSSLPHLDKIQQSFGAHDVTGVQAHVGGEAATASDAMGATAFATGNDVAFKSAPDLHTAAHEAAHVVQQRGGVSLKDGVGQSGDSYERHADAVADAVVRGESAESLLGGTIGGTLREEGVQRATPERPANTIGTSRGTGVQRNEAPAGQQPADQPAQREFKSGDPRGKIGALHPSLQAKARQLVAEANKRGIEVWVFEGLRSIARQNELYAQGRTKPGNKVTWVKGGSSYHNYGLAIDVVFHGKEPWGESHDWEQLGQAGEAAGLEWGGRWKKQDRPHFQMPDLSIATIKQWFAAGGMENVWSRVDGGAPDGGGQPVSEEYSETTPPPAQDDDTAASTGFNVAAAKAFNKQRGYSKAQWQRIQEAVGVEADGIPGAQTATAVYNWQGANNLTADGKVGPATLEALSQSGAPEATAPDGDAQATSSLTTEPTTEPATETAATTTTPTTTPTDTARDNQDDPFQVGRGQLAFDSEGNDNADSRYFSRRPHCPLPGSGVTIGRGYDMKHRTAEEIVEDLTNAEVNAGDAATLSGGAKISDFKQAKAFCARHDNIEISAESQKLLFAISYGEKQAYAKRLVNKWSGVDLESCVPIIREIIVDFFYRGDMTRSKWNANNFTAIVQNNDVSALVTLLQNRSLWGNIDTNRYNARIAAAQSNGQDMGGQTPATDTPTSSGGGGDAPALNVSAANAFNKSRPYDKEQWREIQRVVGTDADGVPGPNTARAVFVWQTANGVTPADGKVGPATLDAITAAGGNVASPERVADSPAQTPTTDAPAQDIPEGNVTANFRWSEFNSRDGVGVPDELRPNVIALCEQLEVIRDHLGGASIRVTSGYRSPAHNARVGGATNSQHMRGTAADIVVSGVSPDEVHRAVLQLIEDGRIRQGGVGKYNSFTHYDIRGSAARW